MKFYALGGYMEVGKNMSALEVNNEVVIFDMGTSMEQLIRLEDHGMVYEKADTAMLMKMGVLPDDSLLYGKKVVGIVLSHGHLDHVNALPKLAEKYNCPILGTKYTMEIVKRILKDHGKDKLLKNVTALDYGDHAELSKNFTIELVRTTHSIPHPSLIVAYTPEGTAAIAYDFKLDNTPPLMEKPDYARMRKLGKEGLKLYVSECVRIRDEQRNASEKVAKILVRDAIEKAYDDSSAVIATTFASHVERIDSILDANKRRRKVVILGRSMHNYISAAKDLGIIDLRGAELHGFRRKVESVMSQVQKSPEKHLILCTGNQGENNAVLSRMARGEYKFGFRKGDQVIFSSIVVPTPVNRANRYILENLLHSQGVRILKDVHVSGHAMREDHRDMLRMLSPEYVVPCHGETERLASYATLASEEGYKTGDTVRIMTDGKAMEID